MRCKSNQETVHLLRLCKLFRGICLGTLITLILMISLIFLELDFNKRGCIITNLMGVRIAYTKIFSTRYPSKIG